MSKLLSLITKANLFLFLLLFCILICGGMIADDYGISADELIQLEGSRSNFRYVFSQYCDEHGFLQGVTPLEKFYNRFYGYAVFFPTVAIEALSGFTLSNATVFRLRHLWNFLNYFFAICCFSWLLQKRFGKTRVSCAGVLALTLLPRAFAESFYNDRDLILLSWFIISAATIYSFSWKPGWLRAFLMAASIAVAMNTRIFSILLFIPLILLFLKSSAKIRLRILAVLVMSGIIWYLITPVVWEHPVSGILNIVNISVGTTQRMAETQSGTIQTLYLGNYVNETELPWHYLPVWIAVTTPLVYLLFFLWGSVIVIKRLISRHFAQKSGFDLSMWLIFYLSLLAVILLRPQMYNGWRHFYYLYLPLIYLAVLAFDRALSSKRILAVFCSALLALSFCLNASWMIRNHPYQMVYFNPLVRKNAGNLFIRDYWYLSARECLDFITGNDENLRIPVWDDNSGIRLIFHAMPQDTQERIFATSYSLGEPGKYLTVNYSGQKGNDFSFPFYKAALHIRVDEMKLASVFERDHSDELFSADIVDSIQTNSNPAEIHNLFDNDFTTSWHTRDVQKPEDELLITFKEPLELYGVTFYQGLYGRGYPDSPILEYSPDGSTWETLAIDQHFGIDLTFPMTRMKQLRIHNEKAADFNWASSELVFHGAK